MAKYAGRKASIIEVDQSNFMQAKPVVHNAIKSAAFVAFDCEFTGLHREKQQGTNVLLAVKSRYAHLRQTMFGGGFMSGKCGSCGTEQLEAANFCHQCGIKRRAEEKTDKDGGMRRQEYMIAQVGLACYIWNEEKKNYDIKCFSFYISPRPWSGGAGMGNVKVEHDIKFSCMGSSLKFLGDHSFDFNRWINDGIPFMSRQQYMTEKERIQQRGQYSYLKDLDLGRGFLEVWEILITSGKPLVGHQCFLDILYLWHQLEGPLHKDLTEVLKEFSSKVRVLVDTKHILTWYPKDLCSLFDKEAVNLRQRKLDRLKADLAEKERKRKATKDRKEGEPDVNSRGSTPTPIRDMTSPPPKDSGKEGSPTNNGSQVLQTRQEERSDLLRRTSEIADAIRENVCRDLQKNLSENEELGNKFRGMHLQDIYKALLPILQDVVPTFSAREHDAGYDAYMTGAVFLGLFVLMHGETTVPTTKTLLDIHSTHSKRKPQSPFSFVNRMYIFAAPYHLDTTMQTLPPMEETHSTTFIVEPGRIDSSHIDANRLQIELRKVDQFAELYWVEFQKKGVVVLFRRDVPPSELYKKLQEALLVLQVQVICVVKPPERRIAKPRTQPAIPSPTSQVTGTASTSPNKASTASTAIALTQLKNQLLTTTKRKAAQLQAAAAQRPTPSPRKKPKSPLTRPTAPPAPSPATTPEPAGDEDNPNSGSNSPPAQRGGGPSRKRLAEPATPPPNAQPPKKRAPDRET